MIDIGIIDVRQISAQMRSLGFLFLTNLIEFGRSNISVRMEVQTESALLMPVRWVIHQLVPTVPHYSIVRISALER